MSPVGLALFPLLWGEGQGEGEFDARRQGFLVIVKESDYDFGWVFCYNTEPYVATGDTSHSLAGNAPIIVDRADGQLYVTGTAYPLDHFIAEYRSGVRRRAEPGASPNGGPAERLGNSEVGGGPPSV